MYFCINLTTYIVMIQSMTGYGKSVVTFNEKKIHVEIKSLNSKALDLSTRIAPLYREKEMEIRQMLSKALLRGKVDFTIWVERDASAEATPINMALAENYYRQIKAMSATIGIPEPQDWFATLLRLPDVMAKTDVEEPLRRGVGCCASWYREGAQCAGVFPQARRRGPFPQVFRKALTT